MIARLPGKRPLSFYVDLLAVVAAFVVVAVIVRGGVDAGLGPLRLKLEGPAWPAAVLLSLLALRSFVTRGEEGSAAWPDRLFGEAGSVKERWRVAEALVLLLVVYYFFVGGAALARFRNFAFDGLSLGAALQMLWSTGEGRFFATTLTAGGGNYLGWQFAPVMTLLAPLSALWPSPETLLRVQTLFLALGAVPVYLMAQREIESRRWALALAGLYLLHPAVRGMNLSGFYPLSLAVAPLAAAFFLLDERPRLGGYLCALFALACGEEAWLAVSFLGLYLGVARRRWREGLFLFLVAFYGFLFLVSFVMPKLGAVATVAERFSHLGGGPKEVVRTVFLHPGDVLALFGSPERQAYLVNLFLPLGGLSLLGPLRLAAAVPQLAGNILSNDPASFDVGSPHQAVIVPFLFAAAAQGLRRLQRGRGLGRLKLLSRPLFRLTLLFLPLFLFGPSPALNRRAKPPEGFAESFSTVRALVPPKKSLAASAPLVPRFARREEVYVFPGRVEAEFVLIDIGRQRETASGGRMDLEALLGLFRKEGYDVRHHDGFFLLLRRSPG